MTDTSKVQPTKHHVIIVKEWAALFYLALTAIIGLIIGKLF